MSYRLGNVDRLGFAILAVAAMTGCGIGGGGRGYPLHGVQSRPDEQHVPTRGPKVHECASAVMLASGTSRDALGGTH